MEHRAVERRVTAADIAREVGVSRATVGFVLNSTPGQTISPATTNKVLETARRLGYRPHLAAQALASGKNRIILLVLPDWPVDYSMHRHIDEASAALDSAGYSLVTMTAHSGGKARPLWETLQPAVVMGMVPFTQQQCDEMHAAGVGVVIPSPHHPGVEAETPLTYSQGPRLQVEHLLARGHHNLVYAGTPDPRLQGLVSDRYDLAARTIRAAENTELPRADIDASNALDMVSTWHRNSVTGVIAYNDDIAALVVGAAVRHGLRLPSDIAVVGHDDSPISQVFVPAITTVHVDDRGLGRYFAELALSAATGADSPRLRSDPQVTLVRRETS